MCKLVQTLERSLRTHIDPKRPILLALSGGSDSMALLALLLELSTLQFQRSLLIHAVHIDHGWRQESAKEALAIQAYAQSLGISCIIHTLKEEPFNEEAARRGRLACFAHLMEKTGSQAVCLAHHKEDQEETLIKRLFEGSGLTQLQGMQEFSSQKLWRPLLSHSKAELFHYREEKQIPYFLDSTNQDSRFLRARMREQLMPFLNRTFGKQIGSALQLVSDEASQLQDYLELRLQETQSCKHIGPLGTYYNWSAKLPDRYLLRYEIKKIAAQQQVVFSRQELEGAVDALLRCAIDYKVRPGVFIEKDKLFFMKIQEIPEALIDLSQEGNAHLGNWMLEWRHSEKECFTDWESGWSKGWKLAIRAGSYLFRLPRAGDSLFWKGGLHSCREIWSQHKVPVILRSLFPLLVSKECAFQFLVKQPLYEENAPVWTLHLTYNKNF